MIKDRRIVVHIGLVKCASTSIQNTLSKCSGIDYVGFVPDMTNGKFYADDEMRKLFDRELRFSCTRVNDFKKVVNDYIEKSNSKTVVFSSENITLRFLSWDLPTALKLQYLKQIFPEHTEFIYIYKSPVNLLSSLYKEHVMLGYKNIFEDFYKEAYLYKDISFFKDICLGHFLELFRDIFGLDNLHLIFMDREDLFSRLSNILDVEIQEQDKNLNPSLCNEEIEIVREINQTNGDFSSFFDRIELHRAYQELEDDNKYILARKRLMRKSAAKELVKYKKVENIVYEIKDENILKYIETDLHRALKISSQDKFILEYIGEINENKL